MHAIDTTGGFDSLPTRTDMELALIHQVLLTGVIVESIRIQSAYCPGPSNNCSGLIDDLRLDS